MGRKYSRFRSQISWGRSRRRDLAKSNLHYVITCQECDRGGKCACPIYSEQSRPILSRTTSLRQIYDMTYEYSLEFLNFLAFMKPNKHKTRSKGFFHNLAGFVFEHFSDSRRIFGDFRKVLSQFAFRNMIVPFYTSSSARARVLKLPSISHASFLR